MTDQNHITLTKPDDWHLHLRDGAALADTTIHSAHQFARAIIMPNLSPPVTTVQQAVEYKSRILKHLPKHLSFDPLMTLYLTDSLPTKEVETLSKSDSVVAIKYYPAGATTNSENGVTAIDKVYPALEKCAELKVPLLMHGEVTNPEVDIFDREAVFIDSILAPLIEKLPELKIVLEHITTKNAAQFVAEQSANIAATITPHHLAYNRNDMLVGGIRPHFYCLPILKRNKHQAALIAAATSGNPKFFLGTDSAPHPVAAKESSCGCAGIFSAHAAIEIYAQVFEAHSAIDRLEKFASHFGPDFYGLPKNKSTITLEKKTWEVPLTYPLGDSHVVPMAAGDSLAWKLSETDS